MTRLALGFAVLCMLALAGCSEDDSPDLGGRYCALFKPCCDKAGIPGDQSFCKMAFGSRQPTSDAAAEQCLKDYEALAKDPTFCDFTFDEPESCKKAFPEDTSGKKPGEPCTQSSDCAGDATCHHDFQTDKETCAAFVLAAEGQACIGERNGESSSWSGNPQNDQITLCDSKAGLICDGTCKKPAAVGGSCGSTHDCAEGGYCKSGTCAARLATGATCTGYLDECNAEAYCVSASKTCEPRRPDGEACTDSNQCLSDYCSDGKCKYNAGVGGLALAFLCQ